MGLGVPPLEIKILLEANPFESRILVRRLALRAPRSFCLGLAVLAQRLGVTRVCVFAGLVQD